MTNKVNFVLTGSRIYGPAKEESDLDIVVFVADADRLGNFLVDHKIPFKIIAPDMDYDPPSFRFDLASIEINIIPVVTVEELQRWAYATEKMKTLPPIHDREARIEQFHEFLDDFWRKEYDPNA